MRKLILLAASLLLFTAASCWAQVQQALWGPTVEAYLAK